MRTLAHIEDLASQAGVQKIWAVFAGDRSNIVIQWNSDDYRERHETVVEDESSMIDEVLVERIKWQSEVGNTQLEH
jgi:hypothetical protein